MHIHLKNDLDNLSSLLGQTKEASEEYFDSINKRPPRFSQKGNILKISRQGLGTEQTLNLFLERYGKDFPASNGPRFGDWSPGSTPASVGGWLTSV